MQKYKAITKHIKNLTDITYGEWILNENDSDDCVQIPSVSYCEAVYGFLFEIDRFLANDSDFDYDEILKKAKIKKNMNAFINVDIAKLSADVIFAMLVGTIRADRFCEGVLLEAFEEGHILRWLKRIKELDEIEALTKKIDSTIIRIWKCDIKKDYDCGWLLREDTLKNAFYFHLRRRLGKFFDENNIKIFTEFTEGIFKGTKCRPDMVIAKVDFDADEPYYCLAVIEFKYKSGYTACNDIYDDYKKLRKYANNFKIGCKLYMATIWEYEDCATSWESDKNKWAVDKLTELNASYLPGTCKMRFYISEHKSCTCKI